MESQFITPLALLLLSALIGVVIRQNTRQIDKTDEVKAAVNEVKVEQAGLSAQVANVVGRVDDLHRWKNEQQRKEADELRGVIERLRRGEDVA